MAHAVAAHRRRVSRVPSTARSSRAAATGAQPRLTTVPTATPAQATAG
nr:hypothetical protein [Streptomyces specialis]